MRDDTLIVEDTLLLMLDDRSGTPAGAGTLIYVLAELGDLWTPLSERLLQRGFIRRERKRLLGLIPTTRLPSTGSAHETELRQRVVDVLEAGAEPDPHTAAVIALVSASGTLPSLHPRPTWSSAVIQRADPELKALVDEKAAVISGWSAAGRIGPVDPHHLIFSIWALTQHYADFEVQVRAIMGDTDPYPGAEAWLERVFGAILDIPHHGP